MPSTTSGTVSSPRPRCRSRSSISGAQAVAKAVKDPDFIKAMAKVGSGIDYLDRDEFRPWWDEDSQQTEDAVRAIGKVQ